MVRVLYRERNVSAYNAPVMVSSKLSGVGYTCTSSLIKVVKLDLQSDKCMDKSSNLGWECFIRQFVLPPADLSWDIGAGGGEGFIPEFVPPLLRGECL